VEPRGGRTGALGGEASRNQWADSHGFLALFVGVQLAWLTVLGYGAFLLFAAVW
jgi:hypothetical protein